MRQRLGQSSQDDIAFALACQRIQLLNELSAGDVPLLPLVAASEERSELVSFQAIDLLLLQGLLELLLVDYAFFKVV